MTTRRVAGVMAIVALATAVSACGGAAAPTDNRTYDFMDVAGFRPEDARLTFEEPLVLTAGEAWQGSGPDGIADAAEPASCLDFLIAIEMLRASDEAGSASDGLVYHYGFSGELEAGADVPVNLYGIVRVFASPGSAAGHMGDIRASVTPCAGGYSYETQGLTWEADSVVVADRSIGGLGDVLVIDERDVVFGPTDDADSVVSIDHYTHYVLSRGNVAFVASYVFDGDAVTDADVVALMSQFISYLAEIE